MLILRRILLTLLAVGVVVAVARVHAASRVAQELKLDLAEIDDLRYGLLDVDAWLDHLVTVLDRQIEGFRETPMQREEVRVVLERTIREVITGVERTIREENDTRSMGALRQLATEFVVDFDALRASSGEYADIAIDQLDRPENRDRLKDFMRARVDAFADSTFVRTDRAAFEAVLARRGCMARDDCRTAMNAELTVRNDALASTAAVAIALVVAMLLLVWRPPVRPGGVELACLLVGVFALLFGGLFTPMIDIEAEITRLDLVLVGEPIAFEHQVLFFQSKSIIDVVDLLVRTARWDLVLVGIAIGLFSVVFPLCKLGATIAFRYARRLRDTRLVRFFALESGKWSMADVFVVAMFLAFLGFDGLTGSQLAALVTDSPNASLATENGTQLRVGFHLFAAFCLAGLALSSLVKRRPAPPAEASRDAGSETQPMSIASV
ncbi:MAG: paraquat-inducible protein A [Gemmatimonadota bacterium]|nr:paraquat-inducible protein A [Gemmatimonadota bacterium]